MYLSAVLLVSLLVGGFRMDVWKALHTKGSMVPGIDAVYGSAAYLPMADSASFQLSLSYNGLTALNTACLLPKLLHYSWH